MTTEAIIKEINKLDETDKLFVIERTAKSLRENKSKNLEQAVND
ncbi:MAG: hypothetical protein JWQ40_3655 [Segetibacter sp.]|nr:hypothetical protein [Segetibacter sp.]